MITADGDGVVTNIDHISKSGARINGGFFVFRREIFRYMEAGEELVEEPFRRLIAAGQLLSYAHEGFWACMDTFKEMQELEDLYGRGNAPWMVWNGHSDEKLYTRRWKRSKDEAPLIAKGSVKLGRVSVSTAAEQ
jgi:glucose-1-phosphate cytidylyltransferase